MHADLVNKKQKGPSTYYFAKKNSIIKYMPAYMVWFIQWNNNLLPINKKLFQMKQTPL